MLMQKALGQLKKNQSSDAQEAYSEMMENGMYKFRIGGTT